jgi:hypothetical protein
VCNNVKTDTVLCYEEVSENASRAQGLRHLQRVETLNLEAFPLFECKFVNYFSINITEN